MKPEAAVTFNAQRTSIEPTARQNHLRRAGRIVSHSRADAVRSENVARASIRRRYGTCR